MTSAPATVSALLDGWRHGGCVRQPGIAWHRPPDTLRALPGELGRATIRAAAAGAGAGPDAAAAAFVAVMV